MCSSKRRGFGGNMQRRHIQSRCSCCSSAHLTSKFSYLGCPQEVDSGEWSSFLVVQRLVKVSVRPHEGRVEEGKLQRVTDVIICEILVSSWWRIADHDNNTNVAASYLYFRQCVSLLFTQRLGGQQWLGAIIDTRRGSHKRLICAARCIM